MSREIRRVPLDFDFPRGETWTGYLRPDTLRLPTCDDCWGNGSTAAARWLEAIAMLLLMLGDDQEAEARGRDLHPYLSHLENRPGRHVASKAPNPHDQALLAAFNEMADAEASGDERLIVTAASTVAVVRKRHRDAAQDVWPQWVTPRPGPDAVVLSTGLAGRPPGWGGHDAIDRWSATSKIAEAAGVPEGWGTCTTCNGEGTVATAEQRAAYDTWVGTAPPTGEGYQLWQTVSEGGPVSPVFATPDELATWIRSEAHELDGRNTPHDQLVAWIAAEGHSAGTGAFVPGRGHVSGVELAAGAL